MDHKLSAASFHGFLDVGEVPLHSARFDIKLPREGWCVLRAILDELEELLAESSCLRLHRPHITKWSSEHSAAKCAKKEAAPGRCGLSIWLGV